MNFCDTFSAKGKHLLIELFVNNYSGCFKFDLVKEGNYISAMEMVKG